MIKLVALASLVAAVTVVIAAGGGVAKADNNAAVHIDYTSCSLFDGNGAGASVDQGSAVITHGGQNITKCSGSVPNDSGQAQNYDENNNPAGPGTLCGTQSGFSDWHETVSASGNATLTCHFSG
jgi:hypothetical protein